MPFNCFKYNNLYTTSKRYHTAAKHSAAFFDSSFNYIKQNSQVVVKETLSHGAKRVPNPHPVNSISANYLQLDHGPISNTDEGRQQLKNPINIVLPYNQDYFILSVHNNNFPEIIKKLPITQHSSSSTLVSKLNQSLQKRSYHTTQNQNDASKISSASSPTLVEPPFEEYVPKYCKPIIEEHQEQNDQTFLKTQVSEIERCFESGEFERINSYYMALKRNNIVPSKDVYAKVLYSIGKRTIDDSVDDQLSVMLNVYQDMICNKIKPDLQVYSIVINHLLESAIKSAYVEGYSQNGEDFFKIAIDIFNASNCAQIQEYNSSLFDQVLVGMNLYPGFVDAGSLIKILLQQPTYSKSTIHYASLINYCRFKKDSKLAIRLYEEFKDQSLQNEDLNQDQFIIYSVFISTLIDSEETSLATKFLDKILTSIKNYENFEVKVTMLLSSYLLTLAPRNINKAIEIWAQFNRIDWIPEFSYEFYVSLLHYSTGDYNTCLKLYNYMVALPQTKQPDQLNLKTLLLRPNTVDSISEFLLFAIDQNDKATVLKMLKESFIRRTVFDIRVYPGLFKLISNDDLITRIINTHGLLQKNGFEYLAYLTSSIPNLPIFAITQTEFFKKLVGEYHIESNLNYSGFYTVLNSLMKAGDQDIKMIELLAPVVVELHDLDNHYIETAFTDTQNFKNAITHKFFSLVQSLENKNEMSIIASEAAKLINDIKEKNMN